MAVEKENPTPPEGDESPEEGATEPAEQPSETSEEFAAPDADLSQQAEDAQEPEEPQPAQPEDVMAMDEEEQGGPVAEEEFPWDKVVRWGLTILGVTALLYLIFRRKD